LTVLVFPASLLFDRIRSARSEGDSLMVAGGRATNEIADQFGRRRSVPPSTLCRHA
jgi:hypothetical protein